MTGRRRLARIGIVVAQWLMLTGALAASIVYSSSAVEGLLTPHIDGSWPFVTAFSAALLLGVVIRSYFALALAVTSMLLGAAGIFAALLVTPALDGTVVWTTALRNYALNQLVVVPLVLALPALFGAMLGALLREVMGNRAELLASRPASGGKATSRPGWWEGYRRE
jgi:hypothetical protein